MTELLYLPDNEYQKEFSAKVSKRNPDKEYVVLDRTCFYKKGGGQPSDTGNLEWDGNSARVKSVRREHGEVRHFVDGEMPEEGTEVSGAIDWNRRYKHMRMHTAQHLVSLVVLEEYGASTAGNQVHASRSRIDFSPVEFEQDDLRRIKERANKLIGKALPVKKRFMDRDRVESAVEEGRTNLELIPDSVDPLRVVEFGDDLCPCGGTHVDNLEEIGGVSIVDRTSKGDQVERIEFELQER